MVLRYSATISIGRRRRASLQYSSASRRERLQHLEIPLDDLVHAGAQHLDHDFLTASQPGRVDLGDRCRGEPASPRSFERVGERPPKRLLDGRHGDGAVEGGTRS